MKTLKLLAAAAAAFAIAAAAFAADILDEYQKKYTKTTYTSDKEEVVKALTATGKPEALKALWYCVGISKAALEDARKDADKLRVKYVAAQAKFDVKFKEYHEQQRKQGAPDSNTYDPNWQEAKDLAQAQADVEKAERAVIAEEAMVTEVLDAHGQLVAKLPPDAQKTVKDDWTKNRLGSKDWGARAECYEMLGHTPTDWAFEMLAAALAKDGPEPDPRALVIAIDGLTGRDAAKAVPPLASRIDDVRWTVRAAVIAALENTPSKEGIDAIVGRMVKEDGRLRDDCARALKALTGQDIPANGEMWRNWWEKNREKWTGKPPKQDDSKAPDPLAGATKPNEPDKRTGFFGLTIESKRVVFVIDISGSMKEKVGGSGPDAKSTKAELAKAELKRVVAALEDGTIFDIVFFSSAVRIWKPEMQTADVKTRREAQDYVDAVEVVGGTNTYDALEAGFAIGDMGKGKKREADPTGDSRVDTIVFLSDGKPSVGRTTDPDAIRTAVRGWNKSRRIAIYAIAFGAEKDAADPKFMKGLADDTGGKFVQK